MDMDMGHFFSSHVVNSWNKLSNETVTAECVNVFELRLDAKWTSREYKLNWNTAEDGTAPSH